MNRDLVSELTAGPLLPGRRPAMRPASAQPARPQPANGADEQPGAQAHRAHSHEKLSNERSDVANPRDGAHERGSEDVAEHINHGPEQEEQQSPDDDRFQEAIKHRTHRRTALFHCRHSRTPLRA
jgi:hypothetical protein